MPVGSVMELYTSVLAWNMYGAIWGILVSTGLVLIPFIATIVKIMLDSRDSGYEIESEGLIRIIETRIYTMIVIVWLAASPSIYVHLSKTTYPMYRCEVSDSGSMYKEFTETSYGDTGTSLDKKTASFSMMLDGHVPKAPLWWYLTTMLGHGITQAAKQELPCQTDLRAMTAGMTSIDIADSTLKDELKDFYNQCWRPAINLYGRERLPESELPSAFRDGKINDDISWPGSEFFHVRAGYYDTIRATTAVNAEHFPYVASRDSSILPAPPSSVDIGGYPTCYEWWTGYPKGGGVISSDHGLRTRVIGDLKANAVRDDCKTCTGAWWKQWSADSDNFATAADADNALMKAALFNANNDAKLNLGAGLNDSADNVDAIANGVQTALGFVGGAFASVYDAIETEIYRKIAPVIQSVSLMMFVIALPIVLIAGGYSLGSLVSLTLLQFSLIFWSFLFALAAWIDNFLLDALFNFGDEGRTWLGYIMPDSVHSPDAMAISWVARMCYWLLPLLFSVFMGAVGYNFGSMLNMLTNAGRAASSTSTKELRNMKR